MVNPTELSLSLLENKLIKEFLTKRQDEQRIRKPADFTRSLEKRVWQGTI